MNWKLLYVLSDPKRIPIYLYSIIYGEIRGLISLRGKFFGMITIPEAILLYKIANLLPSKSTILEIGCYGGLASSFILAGCKKNKSFLYSIDPFESDLYIQKNIVSKYKNSYYRKVETESLNNKPSIEVVKNRLKKAGFVNFKLIEGYSHTVSKKWSKKINFLWIDGNHEYETVKEDFSDWSRFLTKGGYIAFHDANNESGSDTWRWGLDGPTRFSRKVLIEPNWTIVYKVDSILCAKKNF